MTHGVIENSANLVYAGQSDAMNEALADYFGSAIETDAYGIPTDNPDSGLVGDAVPDKDPARLCAALPERRAHHRQVLHRRRFRGGQRRRPPQLLHLRGRAVGRARGRRGGADGKGRLKLMSPNDGRYHVNPATDGKNVAWQAYAASGVDILARPPAGGPVKVLWHTSRSVGSSTSVDGGTVAFPYYNYGGRPGVAYLSLKEPANVVQIGGGTYHRSPFPSVSNGKVVHQDMRRVRAAVYEYGTRVVDVATGADTVVQRSTAGASLGPTAINHTHVFWLTDEVDGDGRTALRRAGFDGRGGRPQPGERPGRAGRLRPHRLRGRGDRRRPDPRHRVPQRVARRALAVPGGLTHR